MSILAFSPADASTIRIAVEDFAALYQDSPAPPECPNLGPMQAAAWHLTKGHLPTPVETGGFEAMYGTVLADLVQRPHLLERTPSQRNAARGARAIGAAAIRQRALQARQHGKPELADELTAYAAAELTPLRSEVSAKFAGRHTPAERLWDALIVLEVLTAFQWDAGGVLRSLVINTESVMTARDRRTIADIARTFARRARAANRRQGLPWREYRAYRRLAQKDLADLGMTLDWKATDTNRVALAAISVLTSLYVESGPTEARRTLISIGLSD